MEVIFMRIFLFLVLLSCGTPEFSPWESKTKYKNLTAKNLAQLGEGEPKSFKFALVGDSQVVAGHLDEARQLIDRSDLDFTAIAGDITDRGLLREWNWIGDIAARFNNPFLTVVGNHDGLNNGNKIYKEMFGPLNYSFEYNGIKFVMWNNNAYEWAIDYGWLEREVEDSKLPVIMISHQPPGRDLDDRWQDLRRSGKIVASLHGHVHRYSHRTEIYPDESTIVGAPEDIEVEVYTVDRVTGGHYGIIEVIRENDNIRIGIQNCSPLCVVIK